VAPRTDGVGGEPSPNRRAGDLGDEAAVKHLSADIWDVEPRQRQAEPLRKLTRNRLDVDDDLRGETGGTPVPWPLLKPGESFFEESFAPL
jgi:hypothetical protein